MEDRHFMPGEAAVAGIRADIERCEAERRRARRGLLWRVPVFDGLTVLAILMAAWVLNGLADPNEQWRSALHVFLYVLGFGVLSLVHWRAIGPARRLQRSLRERILPSVFGFIGGVSYQHGKTPASFDRLPPEAVGSYDRADFDDVVTGRYGGFHFELYEAILGHRGGKPGPAVFKGVVVSFEAITPFPGVLVATRLTERPAAFFKGFFGGDNLQTLQSGIPELDATYEFLTDNVDEARPLVTGRLAKALRWLGETWPEEPSRVALKNGDGFLLIPLSKNLFELPGMWEPLDYKRHAEPMIADIGALLATAALVRKAGEAEP